ncbi:hypothetical protein G7Z12_10940 [Streptomyces sp. ID38640]|uniref:hypothetical protein n=1 Tax=Streptomyces sp. ID38640 TaxID=1265399 RepID=UPI00140ED49C|nr:hypothetical protein [Streptomyces sp. ID38640]QIK06479.1 hypothetical protein G7Z12_10940 [Streptomyces sp. ID38640]
MAAAAACAQVTGAFQAADGLAAGSLPPAHRTDGGLAPAARLATPLARFAAAARLPATRPLAAAR